MMAAGSIRRHLAPIGAGPDQLERELYGCSAAQLTVAAVPDAGTRIAVRLPHRRVACVLQSPPR